MTKQASTFDPERQHDSATAKIVASLDRIGQALRSLLWDQTRATGLSPIQIQLLVHLRYHGLSQSRVGDLARQFDVTPATISEALSTLVDKKLVEKRQDPSDGRARVLALTNDGRRRAEDLGTWATSVEVYLKALPEGEAITVMRVLMGIIERLQRDGVVSVARMCSTCTYFENHSGGREQCPYYCSLLNKSLAERELRFDCPEHEQKVDGASSD
ncbi:MAG: winged helix-turn-helix transcriptional regulator [Bacteroidetes bacterium]|nr:winged helix-turn-helix transcriptional regulator [Bacteroidota bacterium]